VREQTESPVSTPTKRTPTPEQDGETPTEQNSGSAEEDDVWVDLDELTSPPGRTVVTFDTAPLSVTVFGQIGVAGVITVDLRMESGATAESPATVTATVRNEQPHPLTIDSSQLVVMGSLPVGYAESGERIYLAPTEDHPFLLDKPNYGRDADGRWRPRSVSEQWFPGTITLEPESGFIAQHYLLSPRRKEEAPIEQNRYWLPQSGDDQFEFAVWRTDDPGPHGSSRFDGANPPGLDVAVPGADGHGRTAWFHDATHETTRYVQPSRESIEPPALVEFDLYNYGEEQLRSPRALWRVHKIVDGEWFLVAPWSWVQTHLRLSTGERDRYTFGLFHDEAMECDAQTIDYLGGGTYAFDTDYVPPDELVTYATMFDVEAPALTLDVEEDATVEEGNPAVVTLPDYQDATAPVTVTVARTDAHPDSKLIPEQLPRIPFRVLRNSLPLFDGGREAVRVRTDRETAQWLPVEGTSEMVEWLFGSEIGDVVEYRGETYEVTASTS